jgi:tetratricopeptide (TPR) repeat protein
LQQFYEEYLGLDLEEQENIDAAKNYLNLLDTTLLHVSMDEKVELRNIIVDLCDSLLESNQFSMTACRLELDEQNAALKKINLERVLNFIAQLEDGYAEFLQAYQSLEKGESSDSLITVNEGLEKNANSLFGYRILLEAYTSLNDWESVIQTSEALLKRLVDYSSARGLFLDKVVLETKMKLGTAYINCGDLYSSNIEALMGLGKMLLIVEKPTDALESFLRVLELELDNFEALLEAGWAHYKNQNYSDAMEFVIKAQAIDDNYLVRYRLARIQWELDEKYRSNKSYCHAHYVQAIKLNPHFSPSFTYLGHYYLNQESDYERASKCYSKAISINPIDNEAVLSLTGIWIQQGRVEEAKVLLEQFVSTSPRSIWAWKQLGILLLVFFMVNQRI